MASPLYTALRPELSTAITALVELTAELQLRIVPSSVTKRNGGELSEIKKSPVSLKTIPVGVPPVGLVGVGMVTTSGETRGKACPRPLYSVDTPPLLSATQNGEVGPKARPQGLTRFGSVKRATPSMSETRLTRA